MVVFTHDKSPLFHLRSATVKTKMAFSLCQVIEFDPCRVCEDKNKDIRIQNTAEDDLDALEELCICEDDIRIQSTAEDDLDALDELYSHTHDNMEKKCENILVGNVVEYDSSGTQAGLAFKKKEESFQCKVDKTIHKENLSEDNQHSRVNEVEVIGKKVSFREVVSREEHCYSDDMSDTESQNTDLLNEDMEEQQ